MVNLKKLITYIVKWARLRSIALENGCGQCWQLAGKKLTITDSSASISVSKSTTNSKNINISKTGYETLGVSGFTSGSAQTFRPYVIACGLTSLTGGKANSYAVAGIRNTATSTATATVYIRGFLIKKELQEKPSLF